MKNEWIAPHISLDMLDPKSIYILDGEDHGGINDRHWVLPRQLMPVLLGGWDMLVDGRALDLIFTSVGQDVIGAPIDAWLDAFGT